MNCSYKNISPNPNTNLYYIRGWCLLLSDCKCLLDLLPNIVFTGLSSLYSSQATCPCFYLCRLPLCICVWLFLVHLSRPPGTFLPIYPSLGCIAADLGESELILSTSFIPSSLQGFSSQYSTKHTPEEPKVCFPKFPDTKLPADHPHCPEDIKLHHFMITADELSLELHIPHQFFLTGENKV